MLRSVILQLPVGWAARLALLRLASRWQSLLTIVVGVLLAAVIGANAPLYTTAVAQVGMVQRLEQQPPAEVHIFSRISLAGRDVDDLDATWTAAADAVRDQIGRVFEVDFPGWASQLVVWGETAPMLLVRDGEDVAATRLRVAYYDGWTEAVRLVEGTWPGEPSDPQIDLEAALGLNAAGALNLGVGDEVVLDQRGWASSVPVRVRITGIVRAEDERAPYWMAPSPLRLDTSSQWQVETNLLTTRAGFLRTAVDYIPETRSLLGWRVLFDHTRLPFSRIPEAIARLEGFRANMAALFDPPDGRELNFVYSANLIPILQGYAAEVSLLWAPFGLLLLQIGALVLFFLVVTATLVRRGERREIAMLQSRGAFDRQIVLVRSFEALAIGLFGALVGPLVARQVLVWLAPVFTGIQQMPLLLDSAAFAFAAAAAALAFVALMGTLRPVLRLPLILAGGSASRSEKQPWWQRYYLDVGLLVLAIGALWRLVSVSSPLATTQLGSLQADPLLLLAPALLFVALGSVLLRLFPEGMSQLARLLAARRGLQGALATWQVSREPVHYGRIAFLLTLAIGIGWFATSFRATVDRSQGDQARYRIGTDVRLDERDVVLNADRARPLDVYLALPEVEAASAAVRFFNADVSTDRQSPVAGEILAIDADTFGDAIYWRSDLGPVLAPRSPGQPVDLPTPGRVLPFTPARIGLWARIDLPGFTFSTAGLYRPDLDRLLRRVSLSVRLRDAAGTFIHVPLQAVEVEWTRRGVDRPGLEMRSFNTTGWVYLEGVLASAEYVPQGDLRLEAIYWVHQGRDPYGEDDVRLSLADLSLIDAGGAATPLDWLTGDGWALVYDSGALIRGTTGVAPAPDRPEFRSRQIIWDQEGERSVAGIVLDYPPAPPIPAIASESLMALNRIAPGDVIDLINVGRVNPQFQILGTTVYYPTLYQDERPFLVVDRDALLYALNRRPSASVYPSEVWLRLAPGVSSAEFADHLDVEDDSTAVVQVQTLDGALRTLQTNPLSLGLMGLMFLAFAIALALSIVGLMTYAALTAQSRRAEFGVLRALGLSSGQLVASLAIEQLLVMAVGAVLGALLGGVLSSQVVPTLAIGATGEAITPPFVVQVEWAALAQYGLIMLAVLGLVLLASLLLVRRLSLAQTLRLGEE